MPELTTEAALTILIDWLQGNIDCDTDIAYQRLVAYPTAKRCIECQRDREQRNAVR